ncbi:F-box/FBD/LRR-repeat protein-like protein [Tanacetum coccineum]
MNRIKNLLPGIIESILCFLPIEEAVRTSILSREWRAELTDVSESSDGERMFDQPSEKKKLKQLTERHDKCVCEKCKKDHLYWQKWDSAPVNSRTVVKFLYTQKVLMLLNLQAAVPSVDLVVCPCGGGCIVYAQNCNPKT